MRRQLAAIILAAAITPVINGLLPSVMGQNAAPPAAQAAAPAAGAVAVKRVVLYTSGVGYFEHYGTIHGDGSTVLSFKTEQINDVLKSLLLEDLDGGHVTGVSYPTLAPLAQTLKSFQVDLSSDPPLADILKQLRGAQVTAVTPAGPIAGQVLGVEKKDVPVGTGPNAKVAEEWTVNLLSDSGIQPVELAKVTDLKLDDPALAGELQKALAALALSRDKDKKPVTISFSGQGDHRVRVGYVVETPIWKASYRISLGEAAGKAGPELSKQDPALAVPADQKGNIQGWAIVDNQTDNDWTDVELSLVSGRPISFIEDLYQPLYVPRPTVQPDLFAGLQPRTYVDSFVANPSVPVAGSFGSDNDRQTADEAKAPMVLQRSAMAGAGEPLSNDKASNTPMNFLVASQASGAKVGEAFQYTVHDVNLARQKSSMIPILSGPIRAQRLSIYDQNVLPNNPLLGARLTNNTGQYIMQGPVTILDHGIYAGDAQIADLPPDANRLVSYGVDQRMQINGGNVTENTQLLTGKIVKGVLELTSRDLFRQTYVAKNLGDADKTLLIEHPRRQGWELTAPAKATETTDTEYRFEITVLPGKSQTLAVEQQHTYGQAVAILPTDVSAILVYSQNGAIPKPVRDALTKAAQLKQTVADTQRQLAQLRQDKTDLANEQTRMRKDMSVVSPGTDYYKKLLQKLDDQETEFEKMESQEKQLVQQQKDQQKTYEDYLAGLNVG